MVAEKVRFDCQRQFKSQNWANASFTTSPVPRGALALITPQLLSANAAVVAHAKPIPGGKRPKFWTKNSTIVTTDFFAFDTSNNYDKLQGMGQVCDMGDAMVGRAMQLSPGTEWFAIRNASDPQVPMNGTSKADYESADHEAGTIYRDYGGYTTAASVVAAWAIIASS